jgi:hypothetical protein
MESGLAEKIRSRCYWQTVVRPVQFQQTHIKDYSRLLPIVREASVRLRGWDFPHVDDRWEAKRAGNDWVGEELAWQDHLELWRLYQSGQFVSLRGLWHDWQGSSEVNPEGAGPTNSLPLWDSIYRLTEIYEFAARLALTEAGDALMRVEVMVGGLQGRVLAQDHPRKTGLRKYVFLADDFSYPAPDSDPIPIETLVGQPRELAAEALVELFRRFEFAASTDVVRSWQDELDRW